jgi:hypothetical protein
MKTTIILPKISNHKFEKINPSELFLENNYDNFNFKPINSSNI